MTERLLFSHVYGLNVHLMCVFVLLDQNVGIFEVANLIKWRGTIQLVSCVSSMKVSNSNLVYTPSIELSSSSTMAGCRSLSSISALIASIHLTSDSTTVPSNTFSSSVEIVVCIARTAAARTDGLFQESATGGCLKDARSAHCSCSASSSVICVFLVMLHSEGDDGPNAHMNPEGSMAIFDATGKTAVAIFSLNMSDMQISGVYVTHAHDMRTRSMSVNRWDVTDSTRARIVDMSRVVHQRHHCEEGTHE